MRLCADEITGAKRYVGSGETCLETLVISRATRQIGFLVLCTMCASCGSQQPTLPAKAANLEMANRNSALPVVEPNLTLNTESNSSNAPFPETHFDFGETLSGALVEHDFAIRNHRTTPMVIEKVSMTTPLLVTGMPHEVAPGTEAKIHFKLNTENLEGNFEGAILVSLNDPAQPEARLTFSGRIVPPVQLSPRPAFFVAGQRHHGNHADIEIVNHEPTPLHIENIQHGLDRFTTHLETVTPGQRYRLTLALKPDGPVGRATSAIVLRTSSKKMPLIKVGANTYLYEKVHAFPDAVEFGRLRASDVASTAMTMMIHQEGGTDFQARLSSDIPGLSFKLVRGANGNSYQVEIILVPERLQIGAMKGSIFIDSNDREFPRVTVPVSGQIVE